MFHKVKEVRPLSDFRLAVLFESGERRNYNVRPLLDKWQAFRALSDVAVLFCPFFHERQCLWRQVALNHIERFYIDDSDVFAVEDVKVRRIVLRLLKIHLDD